MNRHLSLAVVALSLVSAPCWAQGQTADTSAPTAGRLTPEQIDAEWIAANSKYDGERKRLLADVDKDVGAGPFRDEGQSVRGVAVHGARARGERSAAAGRVEGRAAVGRGEFIRRNTGKEDLGRGRRRPAQVTGK